MGQAIEHIKASNNSILSSLKNPRSQDNSLLNHLFRLLKIIKINEKTINKL